MGASTAGTGIAASTEGGVVRSGRQEIEATVRERAQHPNAEAVRITCSFARAERIIGRDYHGRFLIEMLQNAADAWRDDSRSASGGSRIVIVVAEGPVLLVANQGKPMRPEVVIESLGHIGASTKAPGEAIGHKGIGFKSVLEITSTPEIYSGLQELEPSIAVAFDPVVAKRMITDPQNSPHWDQHLASVQNVDQADEFAAVPILRFPHWIDRMPSDVQELAREGYDTVVRLPFDSFERSRDMSEEAWLRTVRTAITAVSDEIIVLLGAFSEVRLEDRLRHRDTVIRPQRVRSGPSHAIDGQREDVVVTRNGAESSRWRLFRRDLPDERGLSGEIATGLRFELDGDREVLIEASGSRTSTPFHLFFPTRILSGTPFLLHGYFEVDAPRTGFYGGSSQRNGFILDQLAQLVADVITQTALDSAVDLVSVVNQIAACGHPEDENAAAFKDAVMGLLDEVSWIPTADGAQATPTEMLALTARFAPLVADAFPAGYVRRRTGSALPHPGLSNGALEMIRSRVVDGPSIWDTAKELCSPGDLDIWNLGRVEDVDKGFLALLDFLEALNSDDRIKTESVLSAIRTDPQRAGRIIPVTNSLGGRDLVPISDIRDGVGGRRTQLVMARIRSQGLDHIVPPAQLDLAFMPEGILSNEDVPRARILGVRPFQVDSVLDRLSGIAKAEVDPPEVLDFLWRLLTRERLSSLGTRRAMERATTFDPSAWFWCKPGRAKIDDNSRQVQQRERYLAETLLPTRAAGSPWRPAGSLAFGSDWADWIEQSEGLAPATVKARAEAYRALEAISPGPGHLLASPETMKELLTRGADGSLGVESQSDRDEQSGETLVGAGADRELHAFLLRLGVWEVPPIEAFESRDRRGRDAFPWSDDTARLQRDLIGRSGGWNFGLDGWRGKEHQNVILAEDYRFVWSLRDCAERDAEALARAVRLGVHLYETRFVALAFCAGCSDSDSYHYTLRESVAADSFPSCLAIQLRHDAWLACTLDGQQLERPTAPRDAWWLERIPTGPGRSQSPWRFLPICGPNAGNVPDELRRLAQINTMELADLEVLTKLLRRLRETFEHPDEAGIDPRSSSAARQAFIRLHGVAYERLAELAPGQSADLIQQVGVLCELGDGLAFSPPQLARHDDGRFSTYVRHFLGLVPLIALPRDAQARVRRSLGVQPLEIRLTRRGEDEGTDVTSETRDFLSDRVPEVLAILVHHSLGTQTLELGSEIFNSRARRLRSMKVRKVRDLVIDASVEGTNRSVTLGEGASEELFLEGPTTQSPTLFHDFHGESWRDRLRLRISPYLALVAENSAYAHTFALFLQADSDADREEFLLELGITADDVEAVARQIGIEDEESIQRRNRWSSALLALCGVAISQEHVFDSVVRALPMIGIARDQAQSIVEAGNSEEVRKDTTESGPLWSLWKAGADLRLLDQLLKTQGDSGLRIGVAQRRLTNWINQYGNQVVAVFEEPAVQGQVKTELRNLRADDSLAFDLDPGLHSVLAPITRLLSSRGFGVDSGRLAVDAEAELARLGNFGSKSRLNHAALGTLTSEETRRIQRERAAQWQRELRLIAVLCQIGPSDTRSSVRELDARVAEVLAGDFATAHALRSPARVLLRGNPDLLEWFIAKLDSSVLAAPPDRARVLKASHRRGVDVSRLGLLERALDRPRQQRVRAITSRVQQLRTGDIVIAAPEGLAPFGESANPENSNRWSGDQAPPKNVPAIKVDPAHDRRRRELGDEGEQWALAAVIKQFLSFNSDERVAAVDDVRDLLSRFAGAPVEAALAHITWVQMGGLDEEELIEALSSLLHVSTLSDAFGFDLIGWLPASPGQSPLATCFEVKSASDSQFHLSASEWALAERLHGSGEGTRYAVMVVRRGKATGLPSRLDLLPDPVGLHRSGMLRLAPDSFAISYKVDE